MNTYIALLRGINVGGHKKVPMAELRKLLTSAGFRDVKTYIQSGNVILNTSGKSQHKIESQISKSILEHFKFEVPVIVRTREDLLVIFEACPFSEVQKEKSYFILLSDIPEAKFVDEVSTISYENEAFKIVNDCLYFYSSVGYGRTKFNMSALERKLNVRATSRNYKTMLKLLSLSQNLLK